MSPRSRIRHSSREVRSARALACALGRQDRGGSDPSSRVVRLAVATARRLGVAGEELAAVRAAARLHDIGELTLDPRILDKAGPLDERERCEMRRHPEIGERIVAAMPRMAHLAPIIRAAHERWDGTGYPDGLAGEAIPQAARIVFATDAFCAISSRRPHRPARSTTDARDELRRGAGSQFDPAVVAALLAALDDADRRAGSTRRVSTAVLVVLVTALAGGATQSAAAARTHRCGDIPFRSPTQRSVAPGVTDVRAMRLDCTHARLLAAASKGCTSCDYHEGRFHCVPGRRRAGPPVSYPYHCTRRHARVTFTRWV